MMIEFQCRNLVFNPALGHSEPCGNRIIVSDSKIGEKVSCPQCEEKTEVPHDYQASTKTGSPQAKSRPEPRPSAKALPKPQPRTQPVSAARPSRSTQPQPAPNRTRTRGDLSDARYESGAAEQHPIVATDKRKRCKKCGQPIGKNGRCIGCGFAEPKFEKATQPLGEIKVGLAGFQAWFVNTMSESIPFKYLEWGAHLGLAFIAVGMSFAAAFGMGGIAGWGLVGLIGMLFGLYLALVLKGHQLARNPHARLAWYQKPLWNGVLFLARRMNWQAYDERFKGRTIIDRRGEGITDANIPELENLGLCEVLDLERTPITDAGLRHLYGLQNLHCVVLRRTGVTHEGVFRLQQTHPKIWVWY